MTDPGDLTLAAYESAAQRYLDESARPTPSQIAFLEQLAALVGSGVVLEIGSGPGWDADHLESRGVRVERTDATPAFVERLRASGHDAQLLDARTSDLGGPYDAVLANAVLLHVSREQFQDFLRRARGAVVPGGVLAFTLKEGDGAAWSAHKLGVPRHFTYWRAAQIEELLTGAGWTVHSLERVDGRTGAWLFCIAAASATGAIGSTDA